MQFQFVFKHMETSAALKEYTSAKLIEKINKFVTKPIEAQVVFSVQGGAHQAHCSVRGGDGFDVEVEGSSTDMYASVDLIADKLATQLKKHKEKLKHHKGNANVRSLADFAQKKREGGGGDFIDAEDILRYEAARKRQNSK